jgi:transposase-like protein
MDETTLSLHPPLRACWMKQGEQKRISTPGQQRSHHLFGAYNWANDTVTWQAAERKNSEHFIAFLEHLLVKQYPTGPLVLVLDNAPYHKSAAALAALSLFEHRVWVFWLAPYCSTLNLIERFWRFLKDNLCVNKLFPNMSDLLTSVQACLLAQNDPANSHRFAFSKLNL